MDEYGSGRRVVLVDAERFKFLFSNSRPEIPEGYSAPLCGTPTRVLIERRVEEERSRRAHQE